MSPSTIDRALASSRDGLPKRRLITTRPGTLLKHQVAIKTFTAWHETVPGFVEVDLVAHCGWPGVAEDIWPANADSCAARCLDDSYELDWLLRGRHAGIRSVYRYLIRLRRNWFDTHKRAQG